MFLFSVKTEKQNTCSIYFKRIFFIVLLCCPFFVALKTGFFALKSDCDCQFYETRSPSGRQTKRFAEMSFELIKIFLLSWVNKVEYGAKTCLYFYEYIIVAIHIHVAPSLLNVYTRFFIFALNATRRNILGDSQHFAFIFSCLTLLARMSVK